MEPSNAIRLPGRCQVSNSINSCRPLFSDDSGRSPRRYLCHPTFGPKRKEGSEGWNQVTPSTVVPQVLTLKQPLLLSGPITEWLSAGQTSAGMPDRASS